MEISELFFCSLYHIISHASFHACRYVLRRNRHSIGEVTAICIDEYVSLPADAVISARFHCSAAAQAFFSLKKL